jgi:hypothetical protein
VPTDSNAVDNDHLKRGLGLETVSAHTKLAATGSTIVTVTMNPGARHHDGHRGSRSHRQDSAAKPDTIRAAVASTSHASCSYSARRCRRFSRRADPPATWSPTSKSEVQVRRITIADSTRESVTVNERSTGRQYRCVLSGPNLTADEQTECLTQLRQAANSADFVVASGSLPPGADRDARPGGRHAPGSGGAGRHPR